MSVVQSDVTALRSWWSPFHLWRQFAVALILATSIFLLGCYLIKIGFPFSNFFTAFTAKDASLWMAYSGVALASLLLFDGCWLAGLFGATPKGVLLFPLRARFWHFAFAWAMIDLLFVSAYLQITHAIDLLEPIPGAPFSTLRLLLSLGVGIAGLLLIWVRFRLALWPIHVLATGRIGDLETSWRITGGKGGSLFDLTMGLIFASIAFVVVTVVIAFVVLPTYVGDLGFIALPAVALVIPILFRTLQLSAFVDRYQSGLADQNEG
jgi:hypothetical protein